MSGVLVVFAKQPQAGQVKTRLCPPFTPEEAADFYATMLSDVLMASSQMATALGLEAVVVVDPPAAVEDLERMAPAGMRALPQRGETLSARMEHAAASMFAEGRAPVLLRGSDSPAMDRDTVAQALALLQAHDLVLCPDLDGGYNLVGLRAPAPGLFDHAMSTGSVLDDTLRNAARLGLDSRCLAPGFDIDVAKDLEHLARAREEGRAHACERTLSWLDHHDRWPSS